MQERSIKHNFIMNAILTASSFIFPLISFPYVSRILKADGMGKVQFATSLVSYFVLVSQLGIPTYGIRACAVVRDDKEKLSKTVHELLVISFFMMLISYCILIPLILLVPKLAADKILYLVVGFNVFFAFIGIEWLYKALEMYKYITIRSVIFKFLALILMFLFIHKKSDYIIYGAITIFAATASNVLNFINARKYIVLKTLKNYDIKRHLKPIFVFFAMSCAITIYTNLDNVMLGFMTTDTDVGYYGAAVKIKNVLLSVVTSLGAVLLPRVSYYVEKNMMDEFSAITGKAFRFVIMLAAPMTVYFILFADKGIAFLSGSGYEGAVIPMRIIMPTLLFIGLTNIMGIQILVPLKREKIVLYSVTAGGIVDLILNIIFIPKLKASGAALGTLAAEFAVLAVQYIALDKDIKNILSSINYLVYAAAIIPASLLAVQVRAFSLGNFACLAVSAACFFAVYGLILLVFKEPVLTEIKEQMLKKYCADR